MLKGTLLRAYRAAGTGKLSYVYGVHADGDNAQELIAGFIAIQGSYARYGEPTDGVWNGAPLLFSTTKAVREIGDECELRLNQARDRFNPIADERYGELMEMQRDVMMTIMRQEMFGTRRLTDRTPATTQPMPVVDAEQLDPATGNIIDPATGQIIRTPAEEAARIAALGQPVAPVPGQQPSTPAPATGRNRRPITTPLTNFGG